MKRKNKCEEREEEVKAFSGKDLLLELVREIPPGRVVSYKALALLLGTSPRVVGRWLHQNNDPRLPCFRVVRSDGTLALGYKFGGREAQRKRLLAEGVAFVGRWRVAKRFFYRELLRRN